MKRKEYIELKEKEMAEALKTVEAIKNSKDPTVKYKDSRPITDIKYMLETSCEEFADRPAFWVRKEKKKP